MVMVLQNNDYCVLYSYGYCISRYRRSQHASSVSPDWSSVLRREGKREKEWREREGEVVNRGEKEGERKENRGGGD
jgi:hypothetical protein